VKSSATSISFSSARTAFVQFTVDNDGFIRHITGAILGGKCQSVTVGGAISYL
jgi:hypothetical protein